MNVNASHRGRTVQFVNVPRGTRGLPGSPVREPIGLGQRGLITSVDSHSTAPWTRYSIRFPDNTTATGIDPRDVVFVN